jgi:hypothetical protein
MGTVCVTRVRQTETQRVERGHQVLPRARAVQTRLDRMTQLSEAQRTRLSPQLTGALESHQRSEHQSRRLTQGKAVTHGQLGNAYEPTIAPSCKGHSHCPAQFGRQPGMIAEPAAGFILALHLPGGHPRDARYVEPVVDPVHQAITRVATGPTPAIRALAGDLAFNEASLREALHSQGMLTGGIPQTVDPLPPSPTADEVLQLLDEAGLPSKPTPAQVHRACACG